MLGMSLWIWKALLGRDLMTARFSSASAAARHTQRLRIGSFAASLLSLARLKEALGHSHLLKSRGKGDPRSCSWR